MKLKVIFEPGDEGGYTVHVPSLPGCISGGETIEEAAKNIQEAIEFYLAVQEVINSVAVSFGNFCIADSKHKVLVPGCNLCMKYALLKIPPAPFSRGSTVVLYTISCPEVSETCQRYIHAPP